MSIVKFTESGMVFSFNDKDCFRIEQSEVYKSLGSDVKICEVIFQKNKKVFFVEAKSSFAHPGNSEDFLKNISDIYEKFLNAIILYAGMLLDRPYRIKEKIPVNLKGGKVKGAQIYIYLIIKGHEVGWLSNVDDAINQKLAVIKKCFGIESIKAINDEMALRYKLIKKY